MRRVYPFLLWRILRTAFFGLFLASLLCLVCLEGASLARPPVARKTWVTSVCLLLDTPFGRMSVGGITFVTTGENVRQLIKLPFSTSVFVWDF